MIERPREAPHLINFRGQQILDHHLVDRIVVHTQHTNLGTAALPGIRLSGSQVEYFISGIQKGFGEGRAEWSPYGILKAGGRAFNTVAWNTMGNEGEWMKNNQWEQPVMKYNTKSMIQKPSPPQSKRVG